MLSKQCPGCMHEKAGDEFCKSKSRKDGLHLLCRECNKELHTKWRKKNKDKIKKAVKEYQKKLGRYGLSLQRSKVRAKQKGHTPCLATKGEIRAVFTGKCHICGVPETECNRALSLDHNHETGELRGWLCGRCNVAIGLLGDNAGGLYNALWYLSHTVEEKIKSIT